MEYQLSISDVAEEQLLALSARDRTTVANQSKEGVSYELTKASMAIKKLRTNPFAEYELRIGKHRVLYNVIEDKHEVEIRAVGEKIGNKLFVAGDEFHERDSNSPA